MNATTSDSTVSLSPSLAGAEPLPRLLVAGFCFAGTKLRKAPHASMVPPTRYNAKELSANALL